jgi:TM2 domain-containing membrane protein YozV
MAAEEQARRRRAEEEETRRIKNKRILTGILAIFFGALGIHKFLLNKIIWGIVYILLSWTYIPTILGVIEGIKYLMMSNEEFREKFLSPQENKNTKE